MASSTMKLHANMRRMVGGTRHRRCMSPVTQLMLRQCSLGAKVSVILFCWDLHESPKPFDKSFLMQYRRYMDLMASAGTVANQLLFDQQSPR
jgi:hypothetical protein